MIAFCLHAVTMRLTEISGRVLSWLYLFHMSFCLLFLSIVTRHLAKKKEKHPHTHTQLALKKSLYKHHMFDSQGVQTERGSVCVCVGPSVLCKEMLTQFTRLHVLLSTPLCMWPWGLLCSLVRGVFLYHEDDIGTAAAASVDWAKAVYVCGRIILCQHTSICFLFPSLLLLSDLVWVMHTHIHRDVLLSCCLDTWFSWYFFTLPNLCPKQSCFGLTLHTCPVQRCFLLI